MSDCIERKKIMDFCNTVINRQANEEDTNIVVESFKAFAEYVRAIPSAEPEIIRCKDCKHWKSKEFIGNNDVYTINLSSLPCKNWLTASDWYCGSAERKEE